MGLLQVIENAIDQRMKDLHTAYLAKVISATDKTATIQPLGLVKEYGESAKAQAVVSNVPVVKKAQPVAAGDIVVVVVMDRDMTAALKGQNRLPAISNHSMSDSIIVGSL